ncbi:MAG: hypothetical protein EU547_03440 [Promethearchaeota archaeon]|nr:MAG: hypothetical protein EU547_03440 [Candidatus Lokiarchaeota archaeon]
MPSKIRCEVVFFDPNTKEKISLMGKIEISQLFDRENAWFSIEGKIQQDNAWKSFESLIYKPDIIKITFLSSECYFSLNDKDFGLYKSIITEPLKE